MNRKVELKIMLKTSLYCTAVFLLLGAAFYNYISMSFVSSETIELKQKIVQVAKDIPANSLIDLTMLSYKTVNNSLLSENMITDLKDAVGKKTLANLKKNDFLRKHELLEKSLWYSNNERIIVLPMDIEQRLGNLVTSGSEVDIKIKIKALLPKVVLSKVKVDAIIDENGIVANENIGARKTFVKFVLDKDQRNKVYVAQDFGKLFVELYCNTSQDKVIEDFVIPSDYFFAMLKK